MGTLLIHGGYREAEVREHSLEWITRTARHVERRERVSQANRLGLLIMAAQAGWSEEAGENAKDYMEQLTASEEDDSGLVSHLLNPNAQTDYVALRASGLAMQPAQPAPPAEEGHGKAEG